MRLGILNVLFDNSEAELAQFYRALDRTRAETSLELASFILDNSEHELRHAVPRTATYSRTGRNEGYTRGCNMLMEQAFSRGCDAVVTMNVDGFPLPGCVSNLIATQKSSGGDALVEARQFPNEHPRYYDPVTGATDWVSGCCLLITRSTYERLGPLDEAMFLYCEDIDYSFRARAAGVPCLVSQKAFFFHRGSAFPFGHLRRKNMLLSARYIATKWRNPESLKMTEELLLEEGFFASANELPVLPDGAQVPLDATVRWNAADRLTFASARWS